jgi:hypothetical protein
VRVDVHIERVVLDREFSPDEQRAFREALAAELTGLLAERSQWTPRTTRAVTVPLAGRQPPRGGASYGRAIARSVQSALTADAARDEGARP